MSWYPITTLIAGVSVLATALFTHLRGRRDPASRIFSLFCLSVAMWCFSDFLVNISDSGSAALFRTRVLHMSAVFAPPLSLHFVLNLVDSRKGRHLLKIAYGVTAFCLGLVWTPLFIKDVVPDPTRGFSSVPGPSYNLFYALFASCAVYGLYKLIVALKAATGLKRTQLTYVLAAITIVIAGGITYLLLNIGSSKTLPPVDNFLVMIFPALIAYAIVRHRLLDIHIAITRTIVFIVVYTFVLGLPFLLGYFGEDILSTHLGKWWWLVPLTIGTLFATIGPFLYWALQRKAEAVLFQTQQRYQISLRQAAKEIPFIKERQTLMGKLAPLLVQTAGASFSLLYVWNKKSQNYHLQASWGQISSDTPTPSIEGIDPLVSQLGLLREPIFVEELAREGMPSAKGWQLLGASIFVPCLAREQPVGILCLGEKQSGQPYAPDEVGVLFSLATQLGLALENLAYVDDIKETQEQLRQSDRLATAGRLAAAIAHEIKQPLTAIKTFVEELPILGDDPLFRERFQTVVGKELQRMEITAHQLTDFSRPRPLQRQETDLSQIVKETAAFLEPECLKRGVHLEFSSSDQTLLKADPFQMKQALLNLALNSLDAAEATSWTSGRQKRLSIQVIGNEHEVRLVVTDNGCGMHKEESSHLFEPFYTTKGNGTGLGMVVVKQIVEAHHGVILVDSIYGQGTTFTLRLPKTART